MPIVGSPVPNATNNNMTLEQHLQFPIQGSSKVSISHPKGEQHINITISLSQDNSINANTMNNTTQILQTSRPLDYVHSLARSRPIDQVRRPNIASYKSVSLTRFNKVSAKRDRQSKLKQPNPKLVGILSSREKLPGGNHIVGWINDDPPASEIQITSNQSSLRKFETIKRKL